MPQISAKNSIELLEIIQMEPIGRYKSNHNGNAKGGVVRETSWRRSHPGNMSEQDVDDVAFLTGPDSQSSRLARDRAGYGGSSGGGGTSGGRAVAVCSQRRALMLACAVLAALLAAALVLAYAGPQAECGCLTPPPGTRRPSARGPTSPPAPRLSTSGQSFPWPSPRLPSSAEPFRYTLWLHPNLTTKDIKGEVSIDFYMEKEMNFIVLNAKDLNITDKMVMSSKGNSMKINKFLEYKPADQIYVEIKEKFKKRSNYTISLRYNAKLIHKSRGFFISDYVNIDGDKKQMAATNFGLTHARSAFPCFDEPQLKAKFKITIVRDRFHVSLTNMPIAATEEAGFYLGHRLLQDDFQESPEMSTYLVGIVICEFSRAAAHAPRGATISVYADKNNLDKAQTILDTAVSIIDKYETFLNVSFPLPKLDMVIMDGMEDTAEGWGLLGIGTALIPDREHLERLLAHQWLGGLVTPKWWGSRWLTEGLVALLQHAPSAPGDDSLLLEHTVPALALDALPTAHPVSMSVTDPEDLEAVQDELSYHKGAALVGMAWSAAGSGARAALRDFLSVHARSAADPRDLWRLLGRRARADLQVVMESWTEQAGYPLLTLSRDGDLITVKQERFMLVAELPQTNASLLPSLLDIEISLGGLGEPRDFLNIEDDNMTTAATSDIPMTTIPTPKETHPPPKKEKSKDKYRYRWYVPLTYIIGPSNGSVNATLNGTYGNSTENKSFSTTPANVETTTVKATTPNNSSGDPNKKERRGRGGFSGNGTQLIWMNMTEVKFRIPPGVSWIKLNAGGRGLYRANYPSVMWEALGKALSNGSLPSAGDRASLLDDAFTLNRAGFLNASVVLQLCEYLGNSVNNSSIQSITTTASTSNIAQTPSGINMKTFSESAVAPWKAALGHLSKWSALLAGAAAGAPLRRHIAHNILAPAAKLALRGGHGAADKELVEAAVDFELPDAIEVTRRMYEDWAYKNVSIPYDLRQAVYSSAVRHGDEEDWMRCWKAYRRCTDPIERTELLKALASTPDHWLLNRYLQATLDPRLISPMDARIVLSAASLRQPGRLLAWRHLRSRMPDPDLLKAVTEHMATPDDYKEVSEFYADVDIGPALNRSLETIALNVAWVSKSDADILKYLTRLKEESV